MNPMNPLGVVGWACPDCKGWTRCNDDCICPACYKDRHADNFANSLGQWSAFAPMLHDLNDADIPWSWSTSLAQPTVHSVEITIGDNALVELFHRGSEFIAEFCEYNKRDNAWEVKYDTHDRQAYKITSWINEFR
jgi:hypothetical protein